MGSLHSTRGASSILFEGMYESSVLIIAIASSSVLAVNEVTPLFEAWTLAPPRLSASTSSPVTVFTTAGPVRNIYDVFSIIRMKSVRAGL